MKFSEWRNSHLTVGRYFPIISLPIKTHIKLSYRERVFIKGFKTSGSSNKLEKTFIFCHYQGFTFKENETYKKAIFVIQI